ncbi:Heat shock protein [Sparassis crispa]|uniref:Heat shock protein n=1 Tax=Sparassis crispa TaxID=139825 RepID=A0A401G681_9APHY|nr:Heat shock protein [Sparassis crispa]GBE77668.1 Heat shock protein [Sparassis crispa]
MSLTHLLNEPFYSLIDLEHLFDDSFTTRTRSPQTGEVAASRSLKPRMDLHEDTRANTVTVTFELPGLKKEDVDISVQNNMLTVSGEPRLSSEREEGGYSVCERRYGKFSRSLSLPRGIQTQNIKASMQDGVLTVTYPTTTPEAERRKITVE